MKVLEINAVPYGSTCKIMLGIAEVAAAKGIRVDTASGYSYHPVQELPETHIRIGNAAGKMMHIVLARLTGYYGGFSHWATWKLLRRIRKEQYDIIHLHNLHGCYINLPMLFRYIKRYHVRTVWTLHDCWAFTGRCPHFAMAKCEKWKVGCGRCPYPKNSYPQAIVDKTANMWRLKKKLFTGIEDMTIVAPSQWLAGLVRESFLKDYYVKVINNGIDLAAFNPVESDFRQRHSIGEKYILLGVADIWGERKGLDVFVQLSQRLDPTKYQIVLVGTNDSVDKQLPSSIISVHRTQNRQELAEIYTAADLFVNPTREEVLGLVNIEALACGTPVVTFHTGGSPECVDETCGSVVNCNDIAALEAEIIRICTEKPISREACLKRARYFDKDNKLGEYVSLYEKNV